jgi:hypothetical protein
MAMVGKFGIGLIGSTMCDAITRGTYARERPEVGYYWF